MAVPAFNVLSLFSGVGGLDLGLKLAVPNARTVCYVEREAYAAATLVARMADGALDDAPIWDDVTTLDGRPWRGVVDCLAGGFPCQPWSVAGARRGTTDDRWLWDDIARLIREIEPGWVYLENVPGLLLGGLEHVLRDLAALGFAAEWGVLGAADAGAPHKRERLLILAHARRERNGAGQPESVAWCSGAANASVGRAPVADPDTAGCGGLWGQPADDGYAWHHADGRERPSALLADTGRGERGVFHAPLAGLEAGREGLPRHAGGALGDTRSERRPRPEPEVDRVRGAPCGQRGSQTNGLAGPGGQLWPPGPADVSAWRNMPPDLEPAVCRMADGLAYRVDRLRATGNGVVPVVAALAFLALYERLTGAEVSQ